MIYGCSLDAMAERKYRNVNKETDIGKKNVETLKRHFREQQKKRGIKKVCAK